MRKGFIKNLICFLVAVIFGYTINAQEKNSTGLFFNSYKVPKDYRTSLNLNSEGKFSFEKGFTLEFDFSSLGHWDFGYVLRIIENGESTTDLVYYPDVEQKKIVLKVIHKAKNTGINIPVPEEKLIRNNWGKIKFTFNYENKRLYFSYLDKEVAVDNIEYNEDSEFEIIFGANPEGKFKSTDLPGFVIRDVIVEALGVSDEKYYWPLNNLNGQCCYDEINDKRARILNPSWMLKQHMNWQHLLQCKADKMPGITYNSDDQEIIIVNNEYLNRFDINKRKLTKDTYNGLLPGKSIEHHAIYNQNEHKLWAYDFLGKVICKYDTTNNKWNTLEKIPYNWYQNHYHHNSFFHPISGDLMILNGYEWLKYYNDIASFNLKKKYWETVTFGDSTYYPRYLSALGNGRNQNEHFVFGGYGNKDGKQELGMQHYYDLRYINWADTSVHLVWELENIQRDFVPVRTLHLFEEDSSFYTLCFSNHKYNSNLQLYKFSLHKPEYEIVSDTISYKFIDVSSSADLFYNKSSMEFIAVTRHIEGEESVLNFYSLVFPPISKVPANSDILAQDHSKQLVKIILVLVVISTGVMLLFAYRMKKKKQIEEIPFIEDKKNVEITESTTKTEIVVNQLPENNLINLFGGFNVLDKTGENITKIFTPKLQQLFLIITFNTIKNNQGISSDELTNILWPYQDKKSAKNNRGVTIAKLRQLLDKLDKVDIIFDRNFYRVEIQNNVFVDYIEMKKLLKKSETNKSTQEKLIKIIQILEKGTFLPKMSYEWLDPEKEVLNAELNEVFENVITTQNLIIDDELILRFAEGLLKQDSLNEVAMKSKVSLLYRQGKHNLSRVAYQQYQREYKNLFDDDFTESYENCYSFIDQL